MEPVHRREDLRGELQELAARSAKTRRSILPHLLKAVLQRDEDPGRPGGPYFLKRGERPPDDGSVYFTIIEEGFDCCLDLVVPEDWLDLITEELGKDAALRFKADREDDRGLLRIWYRSRTLFFSKRKFTF